MKKPVFVIGLILSLFACTSSEVKIDPAESETHFNLGMEFARLALYKNSLEEFDLALKHNPNNLKALRKKGLVLFGIKQYDQAETAFTSLLEKDPENVQAHINLGMVYYVTGKKERARKQWEHAVAIKDGDDDSRALNNLGNIYKEQANYPKAIEYYRQALALQPNNSMYLNNLGDSYRRTGNVKKAEEILKQSLAINPNAMLTHFTLGMLYKDQKDYDRAIKAFTNSIKVNPYHPEAYYQLAVAQYEKKDKVAARQSIELALKAQPANPRFKAFYSRIESS